MKYRLIALFACTPLTACVGVSPYAAPISNPLADINQQAAGVPLTPINNAAVPVSAQVRSVYLPPVQNGNAAQAVVRPVSTYAPEPLPLTEPLARPEPVNTPVVSGSTAVGGALLPYPAIDPHMQIRQLTQENIQLRQYIDFLNRKISQLESARITAAPTARTPSRKKRTNKAHAVRAVNHVSNAPEPLPAAAPVHVSLPDPMADKLKQARLQYRRGDYKGVLNTLRGVDAGGDGSTTARHSMYLLLQASHRLNHCQSVIQIGLRLASRYANSPEAPEALYTVGECQRGIQQQDIARDTWRKLISSYPNSAAARRARANINKL